MIFKLAQYQHDKEGKPFKKPLTSLAQVSALIAYLRDPDHPNHQIDPNKPGSGVRLSELQWENCTSELEFGAAVGAQAEAYKAAPKGRGAKWGGEISEHVIYAPPENIQLNDRERDLIGQAAARELFPDVPSVRA